MEFRDAVRYKKQKELFIAAEGVYSGQYLYAGKKATLNIGNIKPVGDMPEGTVICNVEEKTGDRGSMARCSGDYAIIVAHNPDAGITRIKLPSGAKKVRGALHPHHRPARTCAPDAKGACARWTLHSFRHAHSPTHPPTHPPTHASHPSFALAAGDPQRLPRHGGPGLRRRAH